MSRRALLAVLGMGAALAGLLVYGLGFSLYWATTQTAPPSVGSSAGGGQSTSLRDQIAAAAMLDVGSDAGRTAQVAIDLPDAATLPPSKKLGPAGVPSGFPHSPLGAAAQLAALEVHVLSSMSIPVATETYDRWALPGGVGASGWSQTRNVQRFLSASGQQSSVADESVVVQVVPAGYQIKGTDGPDWVVACVLVDVQATITDTARMGYGTCERLQWADGRWMIADGTPPAQAPSTWPGSDLSVRAGWIPLTRT